MENLSVSPKVGQVQNFRHFRNYPLLPSAAQMAQTVEFMFSNVAYKATVHKTGVLVRFYLKNLQPHGLMFRNSIPETKTIRLLWGSGFSYSGIDGASKVIL